MILLIDKGMQRQEDFKGLTDLQVQESREKNGMNILTPPKSEPLWKQFARKLTDPLIIILMIAGALSVGISFYEYFALHSTDGLKVFFEPIGIYVAILLATGLAFYFETRANKEFSILNQVNDNEPVEVIRNACHVQVPKKDVVVGDIVVISAGQEIPADGVLLRAVRMSVDESSLTGEPLCQKSTEERDFDRDATYPTNHVLRGTKVVDGHGVFEVKKVGDCTENGKVYEAAQIDDGVKTPLDEQLARLGTLVTNLSYAFAAAVIVGRLMVYFDWSPWSLAMIIPTVAFFWLVIKVFKKMSKVACCLTLIAFFAVFIGMVYGLHQLLMPAQEISALLAYTLQTLMIAVTLIVVTVPEGLPMAVTLSLAYSMRSMLKTNNLVRKMHACETMGATTVICTDKTGTLTQNQMKVHETRFHALGERQLLADDEKSALIKESIALNSTASLDLTHGGDPNVIGNPTEGALLLWLHERGIDYATLKREAEVVEELPFSTERKYMATVVKSPSLGGRTVLYLKGAPEIVFTLCKHFDAGADKETVEHQLRIYQNKGMRTLGFAYQVLDKNETNVIHDNRVAASQLSFLGVVAISDPVRADVPQAVRECMDAGIQVKIVTGDTPGTAKEIGRQIGLWDEGDHDGNIITGTEFAALSDEELDKRIGQLKIISRARPMDKKRLVESLQRRNDVVAVTGDGTNDAPALKRAQVGLSMGDGTSVAKEASDITIIDNSFSSIGRAVMWGRSLYQNIQRFLLFQLTVNVAACLIVLAGAFMGTESPLTVTQMLWVNLIMDTFGAMALASLPPSRKVMHDKPRDRKAFIIDKAMAWNIFGVGGVFFVLLLALLYVFNNAHIERMTDLLNLSSRWGITEGAKGESLSPIELTFFFSAFVMTHFFYMFNAKAFKSGQSAFHFKHCKGFIFISLIIFIGQILFIEVPGLNEVFNVVPMSFPDWLTIVAASSLVLWIREGFHVVAKRVSLR